MTHTGSVRGEGGGEPLHWVCQGGRGGGATALGLLGGGRGGVGCGVTCVLFLSLCPDTQENPELIWNDEAREKVMQEVSNMAEE